MRIDEITTPINQTPGSKEGIIVKQFKQISDYIQKNCNEFLVIAQENKCLLFRGIRDYMYGNDSPTGTISNSFIGNPYSDRRPQDTTKVNQKIIDDELKAAGFKALRSNSIFTSSSVIIAGGYGKAYSIFPLNGFNYTWNSKAQDLSTEYRLEDNDARQDIIQQAGLYSSEEWAKGWGFRKDNLSEALQSGTEIYISGQYLAVKYKDFRTQLHKLIGFDPLHDPKIFSKNPHYIEHVKNPSLKLMLSAVNLHPTSIMSMKNPPEQVQLVAVNKNAHAIQYINNPSERVQMAAIKNTITSVLNIKGKVAKSVQEYVKQENPKLYYTLIRWHNHKLD